MITSKQVRMARAALDWTLDDLATAANLARGTVQQAERSTGKAQQETLQKLRDVFEAQGLEFLSDEGVRESNRIVTMFEDPTNAYPRLLDDIAADLSESGGEVLIGFSQDGLSPPNVIEKWLQMRRAGIRRRLLAEEGDTFFRGPLKEYRLVPSRYFHPQLTLIYGNKVSFQLRGAKAKAVLVIENESIASVMRNMFDHFWHFGKMPSETTCPQEDLYETLMKR